MQYFLGLDPGVQGGIALVNELGKPVLVHKIEGKTLTDIHDLFQEEIRKYETSDNLLHCMLEDVSKGSPKGVMPVKCKKCGNVETVRANMQKPETQMTLGAQFGALQMLLVASQIRWELTSIRDWQSTMGVFGTRGTKTQKKNKHKALAQQLFPQVKVIHAIADALLIAEYCRRTVGIKTPF